MNIKILLGILLLAMMTACADMKVRDRVSRLDSSVQSYAGAIRWARYTDAYAFHLGKDGFRPPLVLEDYEGIRVTAYDIQEQSMSTDQMEATVVAKISFYNDNTGVVKHIKHIQNWWFREDGRRWLLDAAFPALK